MRFIIFQDILYKLSWLYNLSIFNYSMEYTTFIDKILMKNCEVKLIRRNKTVKKNTAQQNFIGLKVFLSDID